jgi:hypothetical protein
MWGEIRLLSCWVALLEDMERKAYRLLGLM